MAILGHFLILSQNFGLNMCKKLWITLCFCGEMYTHVYTFLFQWNSWPVEKSAAVDMKFSPFAWLSCL